MEIQDIDLRELIEKETGERFNRQGYIKCPFHNEKTPSLSIKFFPDTNKYKFMCWGCKTSGDAVDFIQQLKGFEYVAAREYLGLTVEKTVQEELIDKVRGYIEWELSKHRKGQQLLGIFPFTDKSGETVYFKAKFKDKDGKKNLSYYHIEGDKVINKRGSDELPYNLHKAYKGMEEGKVIIIAEGEKDVNTLNSVLRGEGYVASSVKGCKDISMFDCNRIYVCSDTGKAGDEYKWHIYHSLHENAKEFRFINLPGIKALGDNKDVTDWLDSGHNKKDLLNAFERSLDLKNRYELQQDPKGIFKYIIKEDEEDEKSYKKRYLTDFRLIEATRVIYAEDGTEGIKLVLESSTGATIERIGLATVFDDVRTFRNFLGTMDLSFKAKVDDLIVLKTWINKYFALEVEERYSGSKFIIENDELLFITGTGAIKNDGSINPKIKSENQNDIDILSAGSINEAELRDIKMHIFKFTSPEKAISIIGTVINNLTVAQCEQLNIKLHHLLIIGEAGSGKSTILENVVAPILNYSYKGIKSLGLATNFSIIKDLSDGNCTMIYEEHKPSRWDRYKIQKISEVLRNLYDRSTVGRGDKALRSKNFFLGRPVVIAGEEGYYHNEKPLIDRSCIIYTSKHERKPEEVEIMKWITDNQELLNKFGRALVETILNLSVENYAQIRKNAEASIQGLKDRPLNTAINIAAGIEIFNILLKKYKIKPIQDYMKHIISNIKLEVMEGGEEANSVVEQMLILFNGMIEDGRVLDAREIIKNRGDGIFIKTTEMLNQIKEHCNRIGGDLVPLNLKDFRKQAKKSGYLVQASSKQLKMNNRPVWYDEFSRQRLRGLKVSSICPPELQDVTEIEDNVVPFEQGNKKGNIS